MPQPNFPFRGRQAWPRLKSGRRSGTLLAVIERSVASAGVAVADILIVVGTESGNAEMVADFLSDELPPLGHAVEIASDDTAEAADLANHSVVLICTATHGDGELPDNLIPFHDSLVTTRPDLSQIRYGVIALGDQTYAETFCQAGRVMDRLFADLGANKVGERLEIDACPQPLADEDAVEWAKEWVTFL